MTNLENARQFFPKAIFNGEDTYVLNKTLEIEWLGENEFFVVNEYYFDTEVGNVSNPDTFSGNFQECLNFCKDLEGI